MCPLSVNSLIPWEYNFDYFFDQGLDMVELGVNMQKTEGVQMDFVQ